MRSWTLKAIERTAKVRAEGYYDTVLAAGTVRDGRVWFTDEEFERLKETLAPPGLGDAIARVTGALGVVKCPKCEERQDKLNRAFPQSD